MANAKKQKKAAVSFKGVPANKISHYKSIWAALMALNGKAPSPHTIYARDIADMERRQQEAVEKERNQTNALRGRVLETSQKSLRNGMGKLAIVRDTLSAIEENKESLSYLDPQDLAGMARAQLVEVCADMEQALCNLGHLKATDYPWFISSGKLKSEMPKEKAVRHG